ncbi:MAG: VWA domain-containing protein [Acidimicrobiia bacterium]
MISNFRRLAEAAPSGTLGGLIPGSERPPQANDGLADRVAGFVGELRAAGMPTSMTEHIDALRAIEVIGWADRSVVRETFAATLCKQVAHRPAFDLIFDVYFPLHSGGVLGGEALAGDLDLDGMPGEANGQTPEQLADELRQQLIEALLQMDREGLSRIAAQAVSGFAGMEPGRPVGGTYYLYRTLRQLDQDQIIEALTRALQPAGEDSRLDELNVAEQVRQRTEMMRNALEQEIRRRLVADRGTDAMARTLRKPLPEDVDFIHASRDEIAQLQRAVEPLTRALAARLAQRRKRRHRGTLDIRSTIRHSLGTGGVPIDPKFRRPHATKPEIWVVADISGSVASFARFTLHFVHAMASQFSRVRSWVFIDGIDEVTRMFNSGDDFPTALQRVNTEANVVWIDGHSDYGHAFEIFHERHADEVTPRTTIMFLGDARNNYHLPKAELVGDLRRRARRMYWLNPEPRSYWNTGDSVVGQYAQYCDGVFECRNLRQLQQFVGQIVGL